MTPPNNSTADENLLAGASEIQQFYAGATVFITGGTGFLGTLLVEKLLRTCHDLKRVYILIRPKKGLCSGDRYRDYFQNPLFDVLKQKAPESLSKLFIIEGDGILPNLGISDHDRKTIANEVNCIFHIAATTRFNESLRKATHINVRSPRDLLVIAKDAKHLKCLIYVSSAYSFCPREVVEEAVYDSIVKGEDLIATVDDSSEEQLTDLAPIIRGNWPNTYTFTKAVAEDLIKRHGAGLPVAIYRPSMVVATAKEPVPGWIDNLYTTTGYCAGVATGVIHAMYYKEKYHVDIVPADYVINGMLAVAWQVGKEKYSNSTASELTTDTAVYNFVSASQNPITSGDMHKLCRKHNSNLSTLKKSWHVFSIATSNNTLFILLNYLFHFLPALALHLINTLTGKKSHVMQDYEKLNNMMIAYTYFCTHQWIFRDDNVRTLWKKLSAKDKMLFPFDISALDWDAFFKTYLTGVRIYLLKDPLDTLPQAKTKDMKLKIMHYSVVLAVCSSVAVVFASTLLLINVILKPVTLNIIDIF